MTGAELRVVPDVAALAHEGAAHAAAVLTAALAARRRASFVLTGGSTPGPMYERLARMPIDWSRVDFFWGDERPVPRDHADSNFRLAWETLLAPAGVPQQCIHRVLTEEGPDGAAERYEAEIVRTLGVTPGALPPFDLLLLGLGGDGHVASLFPGTAALAERRRIVVANDVPALGTTRITLTFPALNAAREVLVVVAGANKAAALAAARDPAAPVERVPARGIAPVAGRAVILADRAAAG